MPSRPPDAPEPAPRTRAPIALGELRSRVIYSLFIPAVNLAKRFRVPLKELAGWLQLAYFHELRKNGLTLKEASAALDVGMRKAAELSGKLKENFFSPERAEELPRRVEFMLWAEPLSRARLYQLLRAELPGDIDLALERLLGEKRVRPMNGRADVFTVTSTQARLVRPTWMAQIDGINNLMRNVAGAAFARVFDDSPRALLRTLSFRLRPADVAELRQLYEEVIFPRLAALEKRAQGDADAITMDFSVLWCPEAAPSVTAVEDDE